MKICHSAIVDNIVANLYAKFDDDWLWNEKALVDCRSANNPKNNNNKHNVCGHWDSECLCLCMESFAVWLWCCTDIKMLPALLAIEPEKVFALPDHSLADDDFKLMATLSDLADRELVATIGWAKQVPGKPVCLKSRNF